MIVFLLACLTGIGSIAISVSSKNRFEREAKRAIVRVASEINKIDKSKESPDQYITAMNVLLENPIKTPEDYIEYLEQNHRVVHVMLMGEITKAANRKGYLKNPSIHFKVLKELAGNKSFVTPRSYLVALNALRPTPVRSKDDYLEYLRIHKKDEYDQLLEEISTVKATGKNRKPSLHFQVLEELMRPKKKKKESSDHEKAA